MTQIHTLSAEDWRMVLDTVRQVRNSGILRAGYFDEVMKKFPRLIPDGDGGVAFFKLTADWTGTKVLARKCSYDGTVYAPTAPAIYVHRDNFGRAIGAKVDYIGLFYKQGTWKLLQGPCPNLSCDEAESTLTIGTPPDATIGELYEHEVTWTDLENVQVLGLPTGFTFEIDGDTGTITGTPFEPAVVPGEYTITITGTTTENGCVLTEAFNLVVNPCDLADAEIVIGELPEAEEFEPWNHEITFTDVEDIEVVGLPEEIDVTIDEPGGTITLDTDELPATGTYQVVIRGTSIPNGCTIEVEFILRILPCDAGDSVIIGTGGAWEYQADGACFIGVFGAAQIVVQDATDATVSGLPDWIDYTVNVSGDSLLILLTGTPPSGTCAIPSGTLDDWTEYTPAEGWYYRDIEVSATTLEEECTIKKTVRIFLIVGSGCPDPTDYATLECEIAFSSFDAEPGQFYVGSNGADIMDWDAGTYTVNNRNFSGYPGWLSVSGFYTLFGTPPSGSEGTYLITAYGTVAGGPHEGCRVEFTYTLTVS
jgi:hypothetical protein